MNTGWQYDPWREHCWEGYVIGQNNSRRILKKDAVEEQYIELRQDIHQMKSPGELIILKCSLGRKKMNKPQSNSKTFQHC